MQGVSVRCVARSFLVTGVPIRDMRAKPSRIDQGKLYRGAAYRLRVCFRIDHLHDRFIFDRSFAGSIYSIDHSEETREGIAKRKMGLLQNLGVKSASRNPSGLARRAADNGPSVLLVDDSPINLLMLRESLKRTPYQLDEAYNGADAVAKVQLRTYDIIIMDLLMPEMDGFEAMRMIRQWEESRGSTRACIMIALTAWAFKEAEQASYRCGADLHLTKPIRKAQLLEVLKTQWPRIEKRRAAAKW
jgi:CheY-like chemotaxis protein